MATHPLAAQCRLSTADFDGLISIHRLAFTTLPSAPGLASLHPPTLEGTDADCIVAGPLLMLHVPGYRSFYVLDGKRAFERWEVRDSGLGVDWGVAARRMIGDYLKAAASMPQLFGRPSLSISEKDALVEAAEALGPSVQLRLPRREEMGSAAVDGATLGFVSRLVIRAVVMHVEKTRPDYWIHSISFGSLLN
jgi:hypothetical protein